MRMLAFTWYGFVFFFAVFGASTGLGYLIARDEGAFALSAFVALVLLVVALRWKQMWVRELRAKRVQVLDKIEVYYLNDPSSHVFLMASPLGSRGVVFMTRGVLSLLDSEELQELLNYSASRLQQFGLGWDTFLSCIQLALLRCLPGPVRKLFYSDTLRESGVRPFTLFRALPTLGLLDICRRLYLPELKYGALQMSKKRLMFERLLAESLICPPQVTSAIAPHAMVNPWPRALLRTGRPCLAAQASLTSLP